MTKHEFDINIFLNNVEFFCNQFNKKIGTLEQESGVSTGYFSRIRNTLDKDSPKIPKLHVAIAVAKNLHVSLDVLSTVDFSKIKNLQETKDLQYIAELINRTNSRQFTWNKIPLNIDVLNKIPVFARQQLAFIKYTAINSLGVIAWSSPADPGNILIPSTDIRFLQRNNSTIFLIKGFRVPSGYATVNFPPLSENYFYGLWLQTQEGKCFWLMSAIGETQKKYAMLDSLSNAIYTVENTTASLAPEVADEIDSLLRESAFNQGV